MQKCCPRNDPHPPHNWHFNGSSAEYHCPGGYVETKLPDLNTGHSLESFDNPRVYLKMHSKQAREDMPYFEIDKTMKYVVIDVHNSRLGEELDRMRSYPENEDHIVRGEN